MSLEKETELFHDIARLVRELVASTAQPAIAKQKAKAGDYATELDVAAENLIVSEIEKRFPGDMVLAEEGSSDTVISDGRIWIIDPICGTSNLARGIGGMYCTNIALADNHTLVASCVVDHALDTYYWSVGDDEIYIGTEKFNRPVQGNRGIVIEVDTGAWPSVSSELREKMSKTDLVLANLEGYTLCSHNSSLANAYIALGKIDGLVNAGTNPWDICASAFLIQQAGGVVTALDGSAWDITSPNTLAAVNEAVHQVLLEAYRTA